MPRFVPPARRAAELAAKGLPLPPAPAQDTSKKWYVLCVESGKEQKVRANLLRQAKIAGIHPTLYKTAMVPVLREQVPRAGDGKLVMTMSIKYEGYIFLNMTWCDATKHLVESVRDTFGLLPHRPMKPMMPPNKEPSKAQLAEWDRWVNWCPQGLETSEAAGLLLEQQATFKKRLPPPPKFTHGDRVRVIDKTSAYNKMEGPLDVADDDSLTVILQVIGIPVAVKVEPWQIQKTDS